MRFLKTLDAVLNRIEGSLLVTLLSVMVVLSFAQVVLRNAFSESVPWGDILLRHLVLWIGFIGAALATSNDRHINIDAVSRFLPATLKHWTKVLTNVFAAVVCWLLSRAGMKFVQDETEAGSTVYADIPSWYSEIIIPVGFGLLVFHFLVRAAAEAERAIAKDGAA